MYSLFSLLNLFAFLPFLASFIFLSPFSFFNIHQPCKLEPHSSSSSIYSFITIQNYIFLLIHNYGNNHRCICLRVIASTESRKLKKVVSLWRDTVLFAEKKESFCHIFRIVFSIHHHGIMAKRLLLFCKQYMYLSIVNERVSDFPR